MRRAPDNQGDRLSGGRASAAFEAGASVLEFPTPSRQVPAAAPSLDGLDRRRLEALRLMALNSCLAPRTSCSSGACRLDPAWGRNGSFCAADRFRAFVEASDRRIIVYRQGARAVSPDEFWLIRLIEAMDAKDYRAAASQLAFRVHRKRRREALAALKPVSDAVREFTVRATARAH
ncbi:MAG: hypothetical protein AAF909_06805 [Pseudomonadota bacterium]